MWADLTPTQWIAIAWGELIVAYAAYLVYLNWRARKARSTEDER